MQNIRFTNITVFIIFLGMAGVEAIQRQSFVQAGLFAALGVMSLWADFKKG